MPTSRNYVNGCKIRARVGDAVIVKHPNGTAAGVPGWMVYRSWRVGTRRHLASAIRLAERTSR